MDKNSSDFSNSLKIGDFFILLEVQLPKEKADLPIFDSIVKKMQSVISSKTKIKAGIAFTDNSEESFSDFSAFFSDLSPNMKSRSLFYLKGKNNNLLNIASQAESLKRLEMMNVVTVTGETQFHSIRKNQGNNKFRYVDSIHSLEKLLSLNEDFFYCGSVVNPFKYTPEESYTQYYKLMKKVKVGAEFAVTQAGWDMKKLQELKWFLEMRDCHIPTIARIIVLTPDLTENIYAGNYPGIILSDDIREILHNENKYGYPQFISAQWRRIQIMVAGARLMGYSGVQIAGVERPEHTESILAKIVEAINEFKSFEDWRAEYQNHLSRAETSPFPFNYYMFENLFQWQYPEGQLKIRDPKNCELSSWEKIKYQLCEFLLPKAHRQVPEEHFLTKKILIKCRGCKYCRVPLTQFVCPETCPKGLANGPCGGSLPGGICEFRNQKCIHLKIFRRSLWKKEIAPLEEKIIKPAE